MSTEHPQAIPAPKRRTPVAVWILAALAIAAGIAGALMLKNTGEGTVEVIRVTRHSMLPESFVGTPDYYIKVGVKDAKEPVRPEGYEDKHIGNGLDFKLPNPIELENITHVELFDEDMLSDDELDRVDVRGRINTGLDFAFELIGPPSAKRTNAYIALGAGGALLVTSAIILIRSHAL